MFEPPCLIDPKTKKPSVTLTAFVIGFAIVNIKLFLSGMTLSSWLKFESFSGVDYSAAIAALGGVYVMRKNKTIKNENKEISSNEK